MGAIIHSLSEITKILSRRKTPWKLEYKQKKSPKDTSLRWKDMSDPIFQNAAAESLATSVLCLVGAQGVCSLCACLSLRQDPIHTNYTHTHTNTERKVARILLGDGVATRCGIIIPCAPAHASHMPRTIPSFAKRLFYFFFLSFFFFVILQPATIFCVVCTYLYARAPFKGCWLTHSKSKCDELPMWHGI